MGAETMGRIDTLRGIGSVSDCPARTLAESGFTFALGLTRDESVPEPPGWGRVTRGSVPESPAHARRRVPAAALALSRGVSEAERQQSGGSPSALTACSNHRKIGIELRFRLDLTHSPEPLQWIRPPRQVRTQASLDRLLDAAEALLAEKCFQDAHVSEVASRANTSVAAFYRRFRDKDALLHALHERLCEEAYAIAEDALAPEHWEGADISSILESVVPFLISALKGREALDRMLRFVLEQLARLLLERRGEIRHAEPEAAVSFALYQLLSVLVQTYTAGMREVEWMPTDDAEMASHLVESCLAYLGVDFRIGPDRAGDAASAENHVGRNSKPEPRH